MCFFGRERKRTFLPGLHSLSLRSVTSLYCTVRQEEETHYSAMQMQITDVYQDFFCACVFWKGLFGRNPKYQILENRANLVQNMNQTSAWNVENQFSKCADINIRSAQFVVKGTVHPDTDGKSGKFRSLRNIPGASQQNSSAAFTSVCDPSLQKPGDPQSIELLETWIMPDEI